MTAIWISFFLIISLSSLSTIPSSSDPDDQSCLTHLHQSFLDPSKNLFNWTSINLANCCIGSISFLFGVTCNNDRIYKLSLTDIGLAGSISPFLSNCTNLQALDLSSNSLTGPIPSQISSLVNLAVLNLSANGLTGPIPNQISSCAYLNILDLHKNRLSGQIPRELGFLVRLSALDVSDNRLSGKIPSEIGNRSGNSLLPRLNQTAFVGNKDLYGYPLGEMKAKGLSIVSIVGIGLGSGLASLVLSFTAVCIWLKTSERKMNAAEEEGKISHLPEY